MDEKILKWLYDIRSAIEEIESYFIDQPRDFQHYTSNLILKRAVERDLEIIGEAVNRIIKQDPDFPIDNARKIVGLRNQIIHAYDNISDENIWAVIQKHLPILKNEVEDLIKL
ncbi:MAG: DUF86 domain-containing protein [Flammeovirgaceae bacterium]|nr:DUF86 domain-containing protein [Flammeovirgaceae bacterium]